MIDLPSLELVFLRTGIAAVALALLVRGIPAEARMIPLGDRNRYIATGFLIGLHWVLFFLAVKISNVSVCMVGMATVAFWSALLEPLLVRGRSFKVYEIALGAVMVGAIWLITQADFDYLAGLGVAMAAALVAVLFSIANGRFAQRAHHRVIATYQMAGACAFCALVLPLAAAYFSGGEGISLRLGWWDAVWLLALSLGCTVYAYAEYVELLKRLSVFTINLACTLEPVYGIVLGAVIFKEYEDLSTGFFVGAGIILGAVFAHPVLRQRYDPKEKVEAVLIN